MPIYALGEHQPEIHPDAWVMPEAVLIGRVRVGARATIWSGAVLRADDNPIVIGKKVQYRTTLYCTSQTTFRPWLDVAAQSAIWLI